MMDRHWNRQTYRQTDTETDRHWERQTDRQTRRPTDRQTGRQTDRQADRHWDRQTDRQTDRYLQKQRDRQRDWWLISIVLKAKAYLRWISSKSRIIRGHNTRMVRVEAAVIEQLCVAQQNSVGLVMDIIYWSLRDDSTLSYISNSHNMKSYNMKWHHTTWHHVT
jgi:hypothetical protein